MREYRDGILNIFRMSLEKDPSFSKKKKKKNWALPKKWLLLWKLPNSRRSPRSSSGLAFLLDAVAVVFVLTGGDCKRYDYLTNAPFFNL